MRESKILKNSFYSVMQIVVISITTLAIFKLMVIKVGLSETGVFSFLSSITAITSFGSFGFSNSLVYYIPNLTATGQHEKINSFINTSFFSTIFFSIILCIIGYFSFYFIIPHTVGKPSLNIAFTLLPVIVISFFFLGLSSTFLSVLDGLSLMHVRAKLTIAGSLIYLFLTFFFIKKWGIVGIPLAQIFQNIFLITSGYLMVKRSIPGYFLNTGFNQNIFKTIFKYGFNFQIISISQIISDPFIKSMIIKFSGSATTAIFDICVKLLSSLRGLIIASNQTITPQITIFKTLKKHTRIKTFYKANFQLVSLLGAILFLVPIALSEGLSLLLINQKSYDFVFILSNVSIALLINTMAFPAYFCYMGTGNLKWNVISNITAAGFMFLLAPLTGRFIGGGFIVSSWTLSSIIGSVILIYKFGKEFSIKTWSILNKQIFYIVIAILTAAFINFYLNDRIPGISQSMILLMNIVVTALLVFFPVYYNSITKKILSKIKINLWRKS